MTYQSRFARALAAYLDHHTQQELSEQSGVARSVLSFITTGARPPAHNAALAIIRGIPDRAERRQLLSEWLEDNIPENCRDLLSIIPIDQAPAPVHPTTEKERAVAWLLHQLDTNIHAVHCVVDLFRAAGSPDPDPTPSTLYTLPDAEPSAKVAEEL